MFKSTPSDRSTIYDAINQERDYQSNIWEEEPHSLTEFLVFINDYTSEALHAMSREPNNMCSVKALDSLRKIAALSVAAQEQHGVRFR
jgi:hypothetical protein